MPNQLNRKRRFCLTHKKRLTKRYDLKTESSPAKQGEYQKNWEGSEHFTPKQTLKAFRKDSADAQAAGDTAMARKIQMDIKSAEKEVKKPKSPLRQNFSRIAPGFRDERKPMKDTKFGKWVNKKLLGQKL